jgi:hypothetical protein
MAWTTPGTAVAGEVLTAAFWNEQVRDNMLMGNPVFTNEAARDAAISSPVEGQRCYLTDPTVPAATGATTIIPSGIQTVYNGSQWVCITPVSAFTLATGTTTSTSYTASLGGTPGTNPSVTLRTGTAAVVVVSAFMQNGGANLASTSVAVSGATTLAASDDSALLISMGSLDTIQASSFIVLSSLTGGTNTFTLNYRVSGTTGSFLRRGISVYGLA